MSLLTVYIYHSTFNFLFNCPAALSPPLAYNVPAAWRSGGLYPPSSPQRSKAKDTNNFHSTDSCKPSRHHEVAPKVNRPLYVVHFSISPQIFFLTKLSNHLLPFHILVVFRFLFGVSNCFSKPISKFCRCFR